LSSLAVHPQLGGEDSVRGRGLVGGLALLLALVATGLVFLYVKNVKDDAESGRNAVNVVISKEDIPAGTQLDDLVSAGSFDTVTISEDAVVRNAVTDLAQLEGQTTSSAILAGEQISTARLQGSGSEAAGGSLGIPKGYVAVTLPLESPRIVGGTLQRGDHVTIFGTFDSNGQPQTGSGAAVAAVTVTVVPDVELLKVNAVTDEGVTGGAAGTSSSTVTVALLPKDAQDVVFSMEKGTLWLGLLPPNEKGKKQSPTNILKVVSG
ncbi:MAG: Flp pilus assembly protein CpaB, partial [Actinobacteria bacterium]|nr:Flp pilus assembly protein CpaB [Actinomycetota bacterium]